RGWLERFRLRRFGSTTLQLCYVAMGALAWVHDHHASLWDLAGAAPVLLEAGGVMTAPDGSPLFPIDPDGYAGEPIGFLAGDPQAHDECRRELAAGEWPGDKPRGAVPARPHRRAIFRVRAL